MIGFTRRLGATPFVPERDTDFLERLPASLWGNTAEVTGSPARRPMWRWAADLAGRYVELGQGQSDPRYYGYAQAALEPWWTLPDPPVDVLLLRAAIHQGRHAFDAAIKDLSRLLAKDPRLAHAGRGPHRARRLSGCPARMRGPRATAQGFPGFSCMGSVASPSGQAADAYDGSGYVARSSRGR
ncbi:MAG: hypothetical protein ACREXK_09760 [Gammaproteobacteria bacterium]